MFIRLGWLNVVRQLSRSTLALVSLVLAAISLTANLTIDAGYPLAAYRNYRDYLGGDLVVYPVRIMTTPGQPASPQLYRLPDDGLSTLPVFFPHVLNEGFLADRQPAWRPLTDDDLAVVLADPQVASVRPIYRLPAWREMPGQELPVSLHALVPDDPLQEYLVQPWGQPAPPGEIGVWLNRQLPWGTPIPLPGTQTVLTVPRLVRSPDGSLQIDDTQPVSITARVLGYYELPTRVVTWTDSNAPNGVASEQGYFCLDEVWLREADWQLIWQQAAPGLPPAAYAYAATVRNMALLEATVSQLQVNNPSRTIVSAPSLAQLASRSLLIDHFNSAPPELLTNDTKPRLSWPQDMGRLLSLFIYLNAGLLLAARMLTGASARRQEIGILKTLGARRRDIMVMAISEAVVLGVIGSTIGFLFTYLAALIQQLTNHVALSQVLANFLHSYGTVFGETVLIGVCFGLLPAWRLSRLTVSEVLRA